MPDLENGYRAWIVVYEVDDTVVADANTPTLTVLQLAAPRWAGIVRKGYERCLYAVLHPGRESGYLLLRPTLYPDRVGHQSPVTLPSRISRMACSSGTTSASPLSRAALASS